MPGLSMDYHGRKAGARVSPTVGLTEQGLLAGSENSLGAETMAVRLCTSKLGAPAGPCPATATGPQGLDLPLAQGGGGLRTEMPHIFSTLWMAGGPPAGVCCFAPLPRQTYS